MTSRIRLDPNDGWHHITCHRIEDGNYFEDDHDRWLLLRLLRDASEKFDVRVVSYSLMGNHIHLVVHCPNGGVSSFMHHVNGVYAHTYNRRHGRTGSLFTDNFYSKLITNDGQLILTTRYLDRNALELGFDIRTYPWSSYPAYLRPDELVSIVPLDASVPLNIAGGPAAYRQFVETDNARDKCMMRFGTRRVPPTPHLSPEHLLGELLGACRSAAATTNGTAAAQRRRARSAAVLIAHEQTLGYGEEIRRFFGFNSMSSYTSFLYRSARRAETEAPFFDRARAQWSQLTQQLSSAS